MADIGGAQARIKALEAEIGRLHMDQAAYEEEKEALVGRIKNLRRKLDNIKVRAYELGNGDIHYMALAALQEDAHE